MRHVKSLTKLLISLLILTVMGLGFMVFIMRAPIPTKGKQGKDADSFARLIHTAVQRNAWAQTGAIKWSLLNRDYLWDLRRGLVRCQFEDYEVFFDVRQKRKVVYKVTMNEKGKKKKKKISGMKANQIIRQTYNQWLQDRFILEPTQSFFDEGVKRFIIDIDTPQESLFVHYDSPGDQPKDSFQWFVNDSGLPSGVRVWSDSLPVQGILVSFSQWRVLKTGLKISTHRTVGPLTIDIDVQADLSLIQLIGRVDPFKSIEPDPFEPTPTSQPNLFPGSETVNTY